MALESLWINTGCACHGMRLSLERDGTSKVKVRSTTETTVKIKMTLNACKCGYIITAIRDETSTSWNDVKQDNAQDR